MVPHAGAICYNNLSSLNGSVANVSSELGDSIFNSLFNRLYNLKRLEICIRNKLFGRLRTKEL